MTKKHLVLIVFVGVLMVTGSVGAVTSCDDQAKPAFSCPTGYSIMCLSSGGYHWGCGKESGGLIIEVEGSAETTGVKSTMQTQAQVEGSDESSVKIDATVNRLDSKIDTTNESSQRLLPTVNKRTVEAKVTVKGWDADKKEEITGKVKEETKNNPEISSVDISEDTVVVVYSTPAKLFGFIPWNVHLNISADADARVKVKFPWYRFMVKTSFSNAAELVNGVFQNNQTDLEFLKSRATEERQVEIFLKISNTMHEMSKSIISNIKA